MIDDMSLRNLSPATQRSYIHAIKRFSRHFGRSPDRLGLEDVRAFQVYLVSQGISWAALNQTVCALRFFYGVTLDRAEIPERIVYARTPRKLPDILSADEVVRFLEAVSSLKARAALTTAYDADPGPPWQGRERPHGHAVTATAGYSADLLATGPPGGMAVSRPG
jgi:site-specific recombinase XerD